MNTTKMDWSTLDKYRSEIGEDIKKIPISYNANLNILNEIPNNSKILDIGANDRRIEDLLIRTNKNCTYKSMDIDKNKKHDFYSLDEINEKFDIILLFKVIEHMEADIFLKYLEKIKEILNENGKVIIIVPNVFGFHYLADVTHKQFYPYYDLYALFRTYNFKKVNVFRLSGKVWRITFKLPLILIRHLFRTAYIHSIPRTDYCENILLIAYK